MKKEQQTLYVSPQVKTVEIKVQAIICQSNPDAYGGSHDNLENGGEI